MQISVHYSIASIDLSAYWYTDNNTLIIIINN